MTPCTSLTFWLDTTNGCQLTYPETGELYHSYKIIQEQLDMIRFVHLK